ncbi:sensor histidine kinase [Haloferax marisrubri]|uniref:histidine kinase n=1 Tax=Haloferax marisrubri TaxID=1544719 RepID=A0A2P4NT28_9EURY|nr:histidine kinase N-terminal 7TM domain-containing protein [Haloferax marisrubri]POG56289.1 PAS domain-containing sensor histidine kinase [Haloferax marisrubri]
MGALLLATVMSVGVASYGWQYRDEPTGRWFIALSLAAGCWSLFEAVYLLAGSESTRLLWYVLVLVPSESTVFFTLLFALEIAGYERWVSRRTAALFAAWPVLVIAGAATNALGVHALLWESLSFSTPGGITTAEVVHGPLFWADVFYSYAAVGASLVVLGIHYLRSRQIYRKQALVLLVGILVPAVVGAAYLWRPFAPAEPIAISFAATAALFSVGLSRYRILDISPIARDLVIERMADPVVVVDRKSRLADSNPAARALFDVVSSALGSPVSDVFDAETAEALETGGELRVVDDNGEARHFEVDRSAVTDGRGAVRGHLHILHDITERRVRERWFRALTENASDLIFVLDAHGSVTYLSDSAAQTLGTDEDPSEVQSMKRFLHPDDEDAAIETFREALQRPDEDATAELRFRSSTRGWRVFSVRCRNLLDDPVVGGVVVNAHDVTDRRKHEQQLETFANVVSHDLRNPLNVAEGYLELVREADRPDPDHVERIEAAHERMGEIITDVLALARGGTVEERETVSLDTAATEAWANVETGPATLVVEDSASFLADRTRLLQLLENLFRNALEHAGEDVTVTVGRLDDDAGFYVEDDGPGVPPADRPKLFESGFTTAADGTGFGLAIVRTIADTHGWSVGYEDAADAGARFVIRGVERAEGSAQDADAASADDA